MVEAGDTGAGDTGTGTDVVGQVKSQQRRLLTCSKDQEGVDSRKDIAESSGKGNICVEGLMGWSVLIVHFIAKVVWRLF